MSLHYFPWVLIVFAKITRSTVDLNLEEIQYLADHLQTEECRKLVASLHFKSYEEPNALDQAERKISKDTSCLRLLLHWNSQNGEGKGETHEVIEHRLRQIGHHDLADWLGKTVFHQLGQDLERSMLDPLNDFKNITQKKDSHRDELPLAINISDPTRWLPFDTVCWLLVIGLSLISLGVLGKIIFELKCKTTGKKKKVSTKYYHEMTNESTSGSESEDKSDTR